MKYRLTPFHLPTIYFLGDGFYVLYQHSQLENYDSLELAALEPFILIGLGLAFLISDFIIQLTVGLILKTKPRKTIYIVEYK